MKAFTARLGTVMAELKAALEIGKAGGDTQRQNLAQAGALAKGGDFAGANALLDQAQAWLSEKGQGSIVNLQRCRVEWDTFRKSVQAQLQALEKQMRAAVQAHNSNGDAEFGFDEGAVAGNARMIYSVMGELDDRLIKVLDKALNANGAERQKLQAKAAGIVDEYRAKVAASTIIGDIDANGFIPTNIRGEADRILADLARQL
jgi:ElaB/YqjD/DUF883 family membrane-anchored ribosome-binding protein